jgi:hypothetical protein
MVLTTAGPMCFIASSPSNSSERLNIASCIAIVFLISLAKVRNKKSNSTMSMVFLSLFSRKYAEFSGKVVPLHANQPKKIRNE